MVKINFKKIGLMLIDIIAAAALSFLFCGIGVYIAAMCGMDLEAAEDSVGVPIFLGSMVVTYLLVLLIKRWYSRIDSEARSAVTGISWGLSGIIFIIVGFLPEKEEPGAIETFLVIALLSFIIFGIIFIVWSKIINYQLNSVAKIIEGSSEQKLAQKKAEKRKKQIK